MTSITKTDENPTTVPLSMGADIETGNFNYIVELQRIVAQMFSTLERVSSNDHQSVEEMKRRFMTETLSAAQMQGDHGRVGRNVAAAAVTIFFLRLGLPNPDDRGMMEILAQQTPGFGGMYQSGLQSRMYEAQGRASLAIEQYRTRTAARQSDGNVRQDGLALLNAVAENLRNASRAGG